MGRRGLACPVQSRELCRTDLLRAGGPGQPAAMLGPAVFTRAAARGQEALSHADALPRKGSGLLCYLSITPERIQVKTVWEPCGALLERKRVPPQALAWCPQLLRVTLSPQRLRTLSGSNQLNQPGLLTHPASGRSTLLAFFGRRSSFGEFLPGGLEKGGFWGQGWAIRRTPEVC